MNKSYRIVWNHVRNCLMVVSEATKSHGKGAASKAVVETVAAAVMAVGATNALANDVVINTPVTSTVTIGDGDTLTIDSAGSVTVSNPLSAIIVTGATTAGVGFVSIVGTVSGGGLPNYYVPAVIISNALVTGSVINAGSVHSRYDGLSVSVGGTVQGSLVNTGNISLESGGAGLAVSFGQVNNGVNNEGTIVSLTAGQGFGIALSNATVSGGVTNSGSVSVERTGISIADSSLSGGVLNSGLITASGIGVYVNSATVDTIVNALTGTISGGSSGLVLNGTNAIVGSIVNHGLIESYGGSSSAALAVLSGSTVTGGITNSGRIDGGSGGGILINSASSVDGGLTNSGLIQSDALQAIMVFGSTLDGGIHNLVGGTIKGISATGIYLTASTVNGGVMNAGLIQGGGNGDAILLTTGSVLNGGITNAGTLQGVYAGIEVWGSELNGGIQNRAGAAIVGDSLGVRVASGSTINGGITNAGLIQGNTVAGLGITASAVNGGIQSLVGGTITGSSAGVLLRTAQVQGGISNSGQISANGNSGNALYLSNSSSVFGGIVNTGTISSSGYAAIKIDGSLVDGGLTNTGYVAGGAYAQSSIEVIGGSLLQGDLVNTSGATIVGGDSPFGAAIKVQNATINGGISNAGLIQGGGSGILVASTADVIGGFANLAGGTISGDQYGIKIDAPYGAPAHVTAITNAGLIEGGAGGNSIYVGTTSGLDRIAIAGNNTAHFVGDVYAMNTPVTVVGGAVYTVDTNFTVSGFNNAGALALQPTALTGGAYTISGGDFVQNAAAKLVVDVNNTATGQYGSLLVDGNATFGGGTTTTGIDVRLSAASGITSTTTIAGVFSATGSISSNGFNVTDNSVLYDLSAVTVSGVSGQQIDLVAGTAVGVCTGSLSGNYTGPCLVGFDAPFIALTGTISGGESGINVLAGTISDLGQGVGVTNFGSINGTQTGIRVVSGNNLQGAINNQGTISVSSAGTVGYGVSISKATITQGITNAGYIEGVVPITGAPTNLAGYGISLQSSNVLGGLSNSGTIASHVNGIFTINGFANVVATALEINQSTLSGGVHNSNYIAAIASGSRSGSGSGVDGGVIANATGINIHNTNVSGGLNNTGTVVASSSTAYNTNFNSSWVEVTATGVSFSQSTFTGDLVNAGSISATAISVQNGAAAPNNGVLATGIDLADTLLTGNLQNAGTISASATMSPAETRSAYVYGIHAQNASITGGVSNTGVIEGMVSQPGAAGYGVALSGSTVIGAVMNTGTVRAANNALAVIDSSLGQKIVNTGSMVGSEKAVFVSGSTIAGGLTNTGFLNAISKALHLTASSVGGSIMNSGTISAQNQGIDIDGSMLTGSIANSGSVSSDAGFAIGVSNSTLFGDIINDGDANGGIGVAHSTVAGRIANTGQMIGGTGLSVMSSVILGGITNTGTIAGLGVSTYAAVSLFQNEISGGVNNAGSIGSASVGIWAMQTTINGGFANSGTIHGYSHGVYLQTGNTISGALINSGLIQGDSVSGVSIVNSQVSDGISNQAGGVIVGGNYGLFIDPSVVNGGITNAGVLQGYTTAGLLISASTVNGGIQNLAGGTISGGQYGIQIVQNSGSVASVVNGGITNAGMIAGGAGGAAVYIDSASSVDRLVITGNNTASFSGDVISVTNPLPVTVAGGATYTMDNTVFSISGGTFSNEGTLIAPVASVARPTIDGNLALQNGGTFQATVLTQSNYSQVTVSGNVALAGSVVVNAAQVAANALVAGSTLAGVISGSSVTGTFARYSDNSVLYNFIPVYASNYFGLAIEQDATQSIYNSTNKEGNRAGLGAARALDDIAANGGMANVISTFGQMTSDAQISNAVSQTLPVMSGAGVWSTMGVLSSINRIIEARHLQNKGVSTGEDFTGSNGVWMKPFGNWQNQANNNGAYGFRGNSGGLMLGGDAAVEKDTRVGGAFAWGNTSVQSNAGVAPQTQTSNMYQFIGYGSYALTERLEANVMANGGWNSNNSNRQIGFMGTSAQGSYNSAVWHLGAGLSRPFDVSDDTQIIPSARFDYNWIRNQSYSETGATNGLGLNVASQTYQMSILGANAKVVHKLSDHNSVNANLGVNYNFSPTQTYVAAAFQGSPGLQFTTNGINPQAVMGQAGVGYTYKLRQDVDVGVRYDLDFQSGYTNQTATAKARWMF